MSLRPCCCRWEWVILDQALEPLLLRVDADVLCTFPGHRDEGDSGLI